MHNHFTCRSCVRVQISIGTVHVLPYQSHVAKARKSHGVQSLACLASCKRSRCRTIVSLLTFAVPVLLPFNGSIYSAFTNACMRDEAACTSLCLHAQVCACMCVLACTSVCLHACVLACTSVCFQALVCACMHECVHAYVCMLENSIHTVKSLN